MQRIYAIRTLAAVCPGSSAKQNPQTSTGMLSIQNPYIRSRNPIPFNKTVVYTGYLLALLLLPQIAPTLAQTPTPPAPAQLTAAQDHQRLLDLLGITALRPGVSPNAKSPSPVNYDESKA